jgi:ferredoxin
MAKKWYPVIDYLTCVECGTCVVKCPHGVYDTAKAPSLLLKNQKHALTIATVVATVVR